MANLNKKIEWIVKGYRKIVIGADWFCGSMVVGMWALIFCSIIARYTLSSPISYLEEITVFFMIWMTFSGLAYAFSQGSHIRISFLYDLFPPKVKDGVLTIGGFLGVFLIGYCIHRSFLFALDSLNIGAASLMGSIPLAPFQFFVPAGLFLLLIELIIFSIQRMLMVFGILKHREYKG